MKLSISKTCHKILFIFIFICSLFIYCFRSHVRNRKLRINYHSDKWRVINYLYFSGFRRTGNLRLLHSPYTAEARARNGLEHRLWLWSSWWCHSGATTLVAVKLHSLSQLTLKKQLKTYFFKLANFSYYFIDIVEISFLT